MEITVKRIYSDSDATLSTIHIDGQFECFGLEDEYRKEKVAGETRIPAGRYKIGIRDVGGFHGRYSAKFGDLHEGMLQVENVPGFEYILIHIGNTEHNTDGCLLVGAGCDASGTPTVTRSTDAYKSLYGKVVEAAKQGETFITYRDLDRGGRG